ncbi:multiple sugar transport system permease protein [Virgibacillus natechei]|uniref:Multiple sugar transport system permease protein n=1 Tax=Virgibacillus natechei TaxID=1216297 RepID=A0ABS4IK69_9BACI|nr:carbohydrate ABC transporter permease [Virgibacillus natechei]MBP1971353.1 multiple sugar transport system permease protein [Virgibacillus natechei]UZD12912.1 carbohydrate ABC transporter permease [Virgibacillus natechei]
MGDHMKKNNITLRIIVYTILIAYSLLTLLPFGWSVLTSFKTTAEIAGGGTIFPETWSLGGYKTIFESQYPTWVLNSVIVSLVVTILNLIFNTMAGYAFARIQFKGRTLVYSAMLMLIMVPTQVTMIPSYIVISDLGLVNTHMSLVLTTMINIAYIFMMRQFFINFPRDVEEAAAVDGLSKIGTFFRIVIPNALPAIATQAIFVFMAIWNEFMKPLLFITSPDKYMLTQGLNALSKQFMNATAWDVIMAGAIFSIIPIFIIYIILNKYFIQSNDKTTGVK